MKKFEGYFGS